ncbi:MAG: hypothetical protein KTR31_32525 [Myxococcales bacterium]|nr:hypothetical protein [Myxococcales bacterium]
MRALMPVLLLVACEGDKLTTDTTTTTDTAIVTATDTTTTDTTTTDTTTDTAPTTVGGFQVVGSIIDLASQGAGPAGACIQLLDPSPVIVGNPADVLANAVSDKNGNFVIDDVVTDSKIGLLVAVDDCDNKKSDLHYPTNTGVLPGDYAALGDGDTLKLRSFAITQKFLAGIQGSLVGQVKDIGAAGFVWGFALDNAGTPVSGITVDCSTCTPAPLGYFYVDANPADGLFSEGGKANTATAAAAGGAWMAAGPSLGAYSATDTNKKLTFNDVLVGANPGSAVVIGFFANP